LILYRHRVPQIPFWDLGKHRLNQTSSCGQRPSLPCDVRNASPSSPSFHSAAWSRRSSCRCSIPHGLKWIHGARSTRPRGGGWMRSRRRPWRFVPHGISSRCFQGFSLLWALCPRSRRCGSCFCHPPWIRAALCLCSGARPDCACCCCFARRSPGLGYRPAKPLRDSLRKYARGCSWCSCSCVSAPSHAGCGRT
jgi:hypothetical protein